MLLILTYLLLFIFLQENGLFCQIEGEPEILLIYRVHLVRIIHKISALDTWYEVVKNFPKV